MYIGVSGQSGPKKNHKRKIYTIYKGFELCQVFMHNFLYQNVPIFPIYLLLTKRIDTLWSKGINTFWSGGIGTVWYGKSQTKSQQ